MTRTREENAADLMREEQELEVDRELTAEQLDDKYNPDGDGEHPFYAREDWREAVANEDTISGYWNWVAHRLSSDS